jgi:hypothetical protein
METEDGPVDGGSDAVARLALGSMALSAVPPFYGAAECAKMVLRNAFDGRSLAIVAACLCVTVALYGFGVFLQPSSRTAALARLGLAVSPRPDPKTRKRRRLVQALGDLLVPTGTSRVHRAAVGAIQAAGAAAALMTCPPGVVIDAFCGFGVSASPYVSRQCRIGMNNGVSWTLALFGFCAFILAMRLSLSVAGIGGTKGSPGAAGSGA